MSPAGALSVFAVPGVPIAQAGDDLGDLVVRAARGSPLPLASGDVVVVTSKVVSRVEGRFVDLSTVVPAAEAVALAARVDKDPRLVEVILRESTMVSRAAPGVLIVRSRLGVVSANAGVDRSNAVPVGAPRDSGPWVTLLPVDPDASARALRRHLRDQLDVDVAVVITDSVGRPFRLGSTGIAIGVSGLPPLVDQTGRVDLFGRPLEHTATALADQVATAADLLAGQAAEGHAVVVLRGLVFTPAEDGATALAREPAQDLYVGGDP